MAETGNCYKHGQPFVLIEGCPHCIAELNGEPVAETVVALKPGEDLEAHGYHNEALKLLEYAENRVIKTLEDSKAATNDLSIIAKLKKAMELKRREYLDPLKAQMDAIRATYEYLMTPVLEADKITRNKMLSYDAEQRRIRAEQEEINRLSAELAQKHKELTGEITEVEVVSVAPEAPKRVSTEMGTSGLAKIWKFEVIDFSLLPDRFKMENATLIGKVVRAGEREIPGVRIWSEDTLRVTAR